MTAFRDLTGQKFGRLTATLRAPNQGPRRHRTCWLCVCDCGASVVVWAESLKGGHTKSCGCANRDRILKHGLARDPLYFTWYHMIRRCQDPTDPMWNYYGGRGITVCPEWLGPDGLAAFVRDMGERPVGTTLERMDNAKGYSAANCMWATRRQQQQNTRYNVVIEHDGLAMCVAEWARLLGVRRSTLTTRLARGFPLGDVLSKRDFRKEKRR